MYSMDAAPLSQKKGDFECPICRSEIYHYVVARRSDGAARATALYQCGGCSVTFTDPSLFTRCRRIILKNDGMFPGWYAAPADGGASPGYDELPGRKRPPPPRDPGSER